jgi:flagellar biosynthesis protein
MIDKNQIKKTKPLSKKAKNLKRSLDELTLKPRKSLKAVAIKYELKKDRAPKIVATGKGTVAEKIIQIADEHNIPFFEDQTLTDLLSKLELDSDIPGELYTLVAEVLAFVYQLDKLAKKRSQLKRKSKRKT